MGIAVSLLMMFSLGWETWARLIIWLIIGLFIYFTYSRQHSKVQALVNTPAQNGVRTMAD